MRLTTERLKRLIKEELQEMMSSEEHPSNKLAEKLANMNNVELKSLKNDEAAMKKMAEKFEMTPKQIEKEVRSELSGRGK